MIMQPMLQMLVFKTMGFSSLDHKPEYNFDNLFTIIHYEINIV